MNQAAIDFFAKFIERELGIVYSDANAFQLMNRLEEITRSRNLNNVDELLAISRGGMPPDLKQLVLDVATNNETSFFRDQRLFDAMRTEIIPQLIKQGGNVRIWSAASSSGQECYSLAMLFQNAVETTGGGFSITATDISSRILEKAKRARYSQLEVQRGLPAPLMLKYFEKDEEQYWTVKESLRRNVNFRPLNLLSPFADLGTFDLIFCRNVLIYQNVENKRRVLERIAERMAPNSFLVLGAGESMIGLTEAFESVKVNETIIYRLARTAQKAA